MPDDSPTDPGSSPSSPEAFDAARAAAEFAEAMAAEPDSGREGPSPGTDNYTAMLEDEVEALKALLVEKEEALAAARDKAANAAAEVDRVRARLEGSAANTIERARRSVIASFLDVADALDRAVSELDSGVVAPAIAQGVRTVRSELRSVLRQHGARQRPSVGQPFDPAHHEAIAVVPATTDAPAGTITAVLSEGYEIGDVTLRVARVVVAKE
ncbi:MAG: nucleotide exchange factor GrpE [Nannocystaceae bacterium]